MQFPVEDMADVEDVTNVEDGADLDVAGIDDVIGDFLGSKSQSTRSQYLCVPCCCQ